MKIDLTNLSFADMIIDFRDSDGNYIDLHNDFVCCKNSFNDNISFDYSRISNKITTSSTKFNTAKLIFYRADFLYDAAFQPNTNLEQHIFDCIQRVRVVVENKLIGETSDGKKIFQLEIFLGNDESLSVTICCNQLVFEAFE